MAITFEKIAVWEEKKKVKKLLKALKKKDLENALKEKAEYALYNIGKPCLKDLFENLLNSKPDANDFNERLTRLLVKQGSKTVTYFNEYLGIIEIHPIFNHLRQNQPVQKEGEEEVKRVATLLSESLGIAIPILKKIGSAQAMETENKMHAILSLFNIKLD
ncbi:MAG: hypothetical protein GY757_29195 [bacterium]|nr:hypothetical protein [bacterium]